MTKMDLKICLIGQTPKSKKKKKKQEVQEVPVEEQSLVETGN